MQFDQAISKVKDDEFERVDFAQTLSKLLILPPKSPSFTLAIEGAWGIGKTSVINLVKEELIASEANPIIIEFNPWLIGSLDSVVEGFLIQFATSINRVPDCDVAKKAAAKLLQFAKYLTPIKLVPGVEPWGSILEKTFTSVGNGVNAASNMDKFDLVKRKSQLQNVIGELDRPIVVIVDDIDRLPPEEVRIVFQLIKAICDFSRVSYLLAYDSSPVIKALSYDDAYDGEKYLEKIVQVSYPIPRVGYFHLRQYLVLRIDQLLEHLAIQLNEADRGLLESALNDTDVVRCLKTPRDVNRLINSLLLSVKTTQDEVSFADVLLFGTLDVKYLKIAKEIRLYPEKFINGFENSLASHLISSGTTDRAKEDRDEFISKLLLPYQDAEQKWIKSILEFMFPKLMGSYFYQDTKEKRVSSEPALKALLHSGVTKFNVSTRVAKHILSNKGERPQIFIDIIESGYLKAWLDHIESLADKSINDPQDLISKVLELKTKAYVENESDIVADAAYFVIGIMKKLPADIQRVILNSLVLEKEHIDVVERILLAMLQDEHMWSKGVYFSPRKAKSDVGNELSAFDANDLVNLKNAWLQTVANASLETPNFILSSPKIVSVLFRWGQFEDNSYKSVKSFISTLTSTAEGCRDFVQIMPAIDSDFESSIVKFVDDVPEMILKLQKVNDNSKTDGIITYLKNIYAKEKQKKMELE